MKDFTRRAAPKRTKTIIFRLTDAEFAQLSLKASELGLSSNELARALARTPEGRTTVQTANAADPALIAEIKRIGNNLNQIAKHANLYGELPEQLDTVCLEVSALLKDIHLGGNL